MEDAARFQTRSLGIAIQCCRIACDELKITIADCKELTTPR